jgi:hypothetical protein
MVQIVPTWTAKTRAIPSWHRDSLLAKERPTLKSKSLAAFHHNNQRCRQTFAFFA